jgi:hypothetical protein
VPPPPTPVPPPPPLPPPEPEPVVDGVDAASAGAEPPEGGGAPPPPPPVGAGGVSGGASAISPGEGAAMMSDTLGLIAVPTTAPKPSASAANALTICGGIGSAVVHLPAGAAASGAGSA